MSLMFTTSEVLVTNADGAAQRNHRLFIQLDAKGMNLTRDEAIAQVLVEIKRHYPVIWNKAVYAIASEMSHLGKQFSQQQQQNAGKMKVIDAAAVPSTSTALVPLPESA